MTFVERLNQIMGNEGTGNADDTEIKSEQIVAWVQSGPSDDVDAALAALLHAPASEWHENATAASSLLVGFIRRQADQPMAVQPSEIDAIREIMPQLSDYPALQCLLLRACIATRQDAALHIFSESLAAASLTPRNHIELFGDLVRAGGSVVDAMFPSLLEGLAKPGLASFVLDYANFALRNQFVDAHPAADRTTELISLLSNLADRLQQLQDKPPETEEETLQRGKQVTESVALAVALCDALGSIGDTEAIGSLNKALGVHHRRLRVEAAAALARLDVDDAKKLLTAMAAEPIERLRVLAYAEELDLLDDVEEEFANIVARAEAEFVMYLAQPDKMAIAPQHIELLDQCELAWPSYEEPRNCFLFQFVYQFPDAEFTNVGIAGPVVMTFDADLTFLSREDIYALFAGWHVQHHDIHAVEAHRTAGQDQILMHRLLGSLTDAEEYEDVQPSLLGTLLDRKFLIAAARRKEESGWAIVSEDSIGWLPLGNPERPLGAGEAFYLFVGRSLLKSFN